MSPSFTRRNLRNVHLAFAIVIGIYIYSPLGNDPTFQAIIRFGVIPVLTLTGLWMWKQGAVARWFERGTTTKRS